MHGRAACQRRARRPQRIIGHGNQHLIADIEQRMHGETDELGHAIADDDVLERHTFDVFALRVMHDGFARTKNPFGVGITRRERKIFGQILLHLLRHGEVKSGQITDVQLDDARTFRFHLAGFLHDGTANVVANIVKFMGFFNDGAGHKDSDLIYLRGL